MMNATAMTSMPGEEYGSGVNPALQGKLHQGVDLRIGRQGRPDPITNPFERATITAAGRSELAAIM